MSITENIILTAIIAVLCSSCSTLSKSDRRWEVAPGKTQEDFWVDHKACGKQTFMLPDSRRWSSYRACMYLEGHKFGYPIGNGKVYDGELI